MTKEQKLTAIKEAVHKLLPDTMELRWGCQVEFFKTDLLGKIAGRGVVLENDYSGLLVYTYGKPNRIDLSDVEIVHGSPIGIAEILRAIENTGVNLAFYGGQKLWLVKPSMEKHGTGRENCTWNLTKNTIDDQDELTIDFIHSLLFPTV